MEREIATLLLRTGGRVGKWVGGVGKGGSSGEAAEKGLHRCYVR